MPFCSTCGAEVSDKAVMCVKCGASLVRVSDLQSNDERALRMLLPIGRSGWAIASGYLALFSVLLVFAPFALLTGILALRDIKKHPDRHGKGRAWFGIIMGALFSAALVAAFVLTVINIQRK
jgi:hypothetical protein